MNLGLLGGGVACPFPACPVALQMCPFRLLNGVFVWSLFLVRRCYLTSLTSSSQTGGVHASGCLQPFHVLRVT